MNNLLNVLTAALLAIGLLFVLPIDSQASPIKIKGTIREVNLARNALSITARNGAGITVQINSRTQITRNGQPARLHELQSGDQITGKYDSASLVAAKLDARGSERADLLRVDGTISGIDEMSQAVIISPFAEGEPLRLDITGSTSIKLDDQAATLAQFGSGFGIIAIRSADSSQALTLEAQSLAEIRGVIRDVSLANQTVTIDPLSGSATVTLNVVEDTALSLNGQPATIEQLARGFHVRASFDSTTLNARRVSATSLLDILGHIRAVDLENTSVTISPLGGDEAVTLDVGDNTRISVNGEPATLDQLRVGMAARAVYNLASLVAVSIAAHSESPDCSVVSLTGEIRQVNLDTQTVSLVSTDGEAVTLTVRERTDITLNGRPARLHELTAGMRVGARFCRETLIALAIAAADGGRDCTVSGVTGVIVRVHVELQTLVIAPGDSGELLTLNITPRTEITLNERPARLSDLQAGMRVGARLCREGLVALAVAAFSREADCEAIGVQGEIVRLHLDTQSLVIAPNGSDEGVTLTITDRTEITLNGRPARLSDLRPGQRVAARFCRETLTALSIAAASRQ